MTVRRAGTASEQGQRHTGEHEISCSCGVPQKLNGRQRDVSVCCHSMDLNWGVERTVAHGVDRIRWTTIRSLVEPSG